MKLNHKKARKDLADARAHYLASVDTQTQAGVRKASDAVKRASALFVEALRDGALPCPHCGALPHAIEQPRPGGSGFEYEVGCLTCGPFVHTDGTKRQHRVRGGLLPRHAVDAWNEGPAEWMLG